MSPIAALLKSQEPGNIFPIGAVERETGRTCHIGRHALEGRCLGLDLDKDLLLVAYEIDPVTRGHNQHGALDELGPGAEFGDSERLGDVGESILPRTSQRDRSGERHHQGSQLHNSAHGSHSSFDFDAHHAADARTGQVTRPSRPYDWSLDDPGKAYHIGPSSPVIPPDLDPHVKRPVIHLRDSREARLAYLRSTMIGYAAIAFLFIISVATFYAAAVRLPAVQQASIDAEGV